MKKLEKMKKDFHQFFLDWEAYFSDAKYQSLDAAKKLAEDIIKIHEDAKSLEHVKGFEEEASLTLYLLSTPFGAPFVSNISLFAAATNFHSSPHSEEFIHLLKDFEKYKKAFGDEIFYIVKDLLNDIENEESKNEEL